MQASRINSDPNGQSQEKGISFFYPVFVFLCVYVLGQKLKIRNLKPKTPSKEPKERLYSP